MGRNKRNKPAKSSGKKEGLAPKSAGGGATPERKGADAAARPFELEELEARILLSTFTLQDPSAAIGSDVEEQQLSADEQKLTAEEVVGLAGPSDDSSPATFDDAAAMDGTTDQAADEIRRELVFIDEGVEDYDQLLNDLVASTDSGREFEVFLLSNARDGIEQITDILNDYQAVDAIHIISHGSEGAAQLGDGWLSGDTLGDYESQLASWSEALSEEADLLFYGCDLAGGESGEALVGSIAKLTGADVAASDDLTGAAVLGGDWDLEYQAGEIDVAVATSAELQDRYQNLLATINGTAGDDVLLGTAGNDTIIGGEGTDTVDYSGAAGSITVDLTLTTAQDTGGAGFDTLSGIEGVIGTANGNVFKFSDPIDGATYHVTGGGYAFDRIDLSNFSESAISFGSGSVTLDMGGGESFTITYDTIRYIDLADATVHVTTGFFSSGSTVYGTHYYVDEDSAIRLEHTGPGAIEVKWYTGSNTLKIESLSGGSSMATSVAITEVMGSASVSTVDLNRDLGNLTVPGDITSVTLTGGAQLGTLDLNGGAGQVGTISYDTDLTAALTVNGDVTAGIVVTGAISDTVDVSGDVGSITAGTASSGTINVGGDLDSATFTSGYAGVLTADQVLGTLSIVDGAYSDDTTYGTPTLVVYVHNDAPVIDLDANDSSGAGGSDFTATWAKGGGPATVVDTDATLVDVDENVTLINVFISNPQDGADEFLSADPGATGLSVSYSAATHRLVISGSATAAQYQDVLRTVTYDNVSSNPSTTPRLITFAPRDSLSTGNTATTTLTINALAASNTLPTANAGGPYSIVEGGMLVLDASASSDADADTLTYSWDLDNDGTFGDAVGVSPTLTWAQLQSFGIDDDGSYPIAVQVDDGNGGVVTAGATLTVTNVAPTLTATGASTIGDGALYTLDLSSIDPGDDTIISWTINWGDGNIETVAGATPSVGHVYGVAGMTYEITVSATDEDGNFTSSNLLTASDWNDGLFLLDGNTGDVESTLSGAAMPTRPAGVEIGPDGDYYITSSSADSILRFDSTTGTTSSTFVASGSGGLNSPFGMAFGADANLYVASYASGEILRYDGSTGAFMDVFVASGSGGMTAPSNLEFGPDGQLYVTDWSSGKVQRYDGDTGAYVDDFVDTGGGGVSDIAFGPDGYVYVSNAISNQIYKVDGSTGAILHNVSSGSAYQLEFGPDGSLYVSRWGADAIERYDVSTMTSLGTFADTGDGLDGPWGIEFTPDQQVTVVAAVNNAPVITSDGGAATAAINVAENTTAVTTVTATDADLDTPIYSIDAASDDAAFFNIDSGTGVLTFVTPPDFETPADLDGDNVYEVTVQVSDGDGGVDTQALSVSVTDVATNLVVTTMADLDDGDTSSAEALNASKGVDGAVSLSEAITAANNSAETVTISFNISDPLAGGVHTFVIAPGGLPAITSPVIIDATTEPDYSGTPIIELDGSSAGAGISGLTLGAGSDGSVICGLVINRFNQSGILIDGSDGHTISGNYIGTDPSGNVQSGSDVQATGITINDSSGNIIGGTASGDANVLSGNRLRGVIIIGSTSTDNVVSGNFIGTNADGSAALTNVGGGQQIGVYLYDTPDNTIGGAAPDAENVISGNSTYGIYAWGANSTGNAILGNIIGLDASFSTAIGNGNAGGGGIMLSNAPGNLIGGTTADAGNVISGHLGAGLIINAAGGTGNTVLANAIYDNASLGLDLGADGVTDNDAGDVDAGANDLQNFPIIESVALDGTDLILGGSLDTDGLTTQYRIEFYGNAAGTQDATNGEARVYLGSTTVTTDGSGDAIFSNVTFSGVTLSTGDYVTATATKIENPGQVGIDDQLAYGSTSEFAANVVVTLHNVAPTAVGENYTSIEGVPYTAELGFTDLLLNDSDVDGDTLSVNTTPVSGPTNGTLILNADGTFTYTPNHNFNGTDSFVYEVLDGNGGSATATASFTVQPREIRILFTTESDVNNSRVPGISSWDAGDVLAIGDPNLSFEPAGSDGSVLPYMDLEAFSASGDMTINGLHFVSNDVTVGSGANSVDLQRGDLLFVSDANEVMTSNNSLAIQSGDVLVFRPNAVDDYSAGTFIHLLDQPGTNTTTGITLIENDVLVGDVTLTSGSFLFTQESVVEESSIYHFSADEVGAGTTTGTVSALISSVDVGVTYNNFVGVMVITEDLYLDGTTVQAGSIVTTLGGGQIVGDSATMVNEDEIFYLTVTSTTMGSGTTSADATVLFDGGEVGLNNNQKKMRSLAIIEEIRATPNADPVVTLPSGPINYTELDPATLLDPGATLVDPDSVNFDGGLLRVDLGTTGSLNDRLAIRNEGTAAGQIGISGSDVTYGGVVIGSFTGGTDGSDPLTVIFNSSADVDSVQAVLRNITYENVSSDPSTNQRAAEFTLSDGDAGVSNPVVKVIVVNDVNTAPVLAGANDLDAIDEDPLVNGGTLVSDLISGQLSDVDPGAVGGIAVVGVDDTNGTWEFSIDGGTTWTAFGSPDLTAARLVSADAGSFVRFVPDADWNGTVTNGITFHAWDQTSGANGDVVDTTSSATLLDQFSSVSWANNDGSAAWTSDWVEFDDNGSAASGNVRVENDKLRLDNLDGGTKESVKRSADLSSAATATLSFDYDAFAEGGLDIVAFEVSNDGGASWTLLESLEMVGNISGSRSFTLESYTSLTADMEIRFRVVQGLGGTTQHINFDNVQIAYSGTGSGGSSSVSTESASSSITVNAINDDPTNAGSLPTSIIVTEDVAGNVDLSTIDLDDVDEAGAGLALTLTTATGGNLSATGGGGVVVGGSGTGTLTLSGTEADLNTFLDTASSIQYLHATPNLAGAAADSITVTVTDNGNTGSGGGGDIALGVVSVDITSVNDEQVLASNAGDTVVEGSTGNVITTAMLETTDFDHVTTAIVYTVDAAPAHGTLYRDGVALSASNTFTQADIDAGWMTYDHDGGELPTDAFAFTVDDGLGSSISTTFNWTVTAVNDAPTAVPDADSVLEAGTVTIDLAANDTDPDNALDLTSIVIVGAPANGSVFVNPDGTVDYAHDGSETTTDSFTYTIQDASGAVSNTTTVSLTITPQNDNPVLGNNALTIGEGGTVVLTGADLSATDAETAGGLLEFTVTGVTGGQFELVAAAGAEITTFTQQQIADGDVQFVHDGGEAAPTYDVTVSDGALVDGPLAATISFTNVNDAPTAVADTDTVAEGNAVTIDLAANDTDPDNALDLTSIVIVGAPANGSVFVNPDGTVDYAHDGSETTTDSFTYTIQDASGAVSNTTTVSLTITPQNDNPVLGNNALTIGEGGTVVLTGADLSATDAETAGGLLEFTVTGVTGGQFELVAAAGAEITTFTQQQLTDGDVQFVHDGGEAAPTYDVTVSDGALVDGPLAATISFTNVNDAPTAVADTDTVAEGNAVTIDLAANDTDPDNALDLTSIVIVGAPANGSVFVNPDGTVDYAHDGSETTTDSFTYTIQDASGAVSNTTTVSLTITSQNDNPVLGNNALTIGEGGTVVLTGADLSATDAETAGGLLEFTVTGVTGGQFELVAAPGAEITTFTQQQIADGDVQFVHDGGEAAPTYDVTVSDGALVDGPLAATISFTNVNDAPTAVADTDTVAEGNVVTIDLAANDTDPDNALDLTSIVIVGAPANGSVFVNPDGTVDYAHDGSETTTDSFTYTIQDASGAVSNTTTVSLTITPQNDNPVLGNNALTIGEGGTVVLTGADLSATDAETAGGLLEFTVTGVTGGQFELVAAAGAEITTFTQQQIADGDVQFVHDGGEAAPTYDVTVSDGALVDGPLAATISFTNVNDAPTAVADTDTVAEGNAVTIDLAANDTDPDNALDLTSIVIVGAPANGSVFVNPDGTVDYAHDGSETTTDSFTYTIQDASGAVSNTTTVSLTITSQNDNPVLGNNALTIGEGGTVVLTGADLSATDAETAGGLLEFTVTGVTGGQFELVAAAGAEITTFTQQQIADGDVQFVHDGGEAAPTYDVTVSDGALVDGPLAATISFTNVNDAPTAVADTDTVAEGNAVTIDLAANDTDPDNALDLTSIVIVGAPANGSVFVNPDGTVDYAHDGSETTTDSFTYTIQDASGAVSNTTTVSLTITSQNDNPVLGNNALTIGEGGTVVLTGADLSATDAETAGGLLEFTVTGVTGGQFELVAAAGAEITTFTQQQIADGDVQFVHDGGEAAPTYDVTVSDGALVDGPLAATISFTNVNDAPTAVADTDTVAEGNAVTIDLAANDTDPDNALDLTSIVIVGAPANGSVFVNPDGTVDYAHDGSETTTDSFTYTIQDASGAVSNTTTVSLTITPQNDNPVLGNNALTIGEGGTVVLTGADLSATDAETAGGLLEFTVTGVTGGQFELVATPGAEITTFTQQQLTDGDVQFVHDGGEAAPTYDVTVSDGALVDGPLAATISFTNVNDAPMLDLDADDSVSIGTGYDSTFVMSTGPVSIVDADASITDSDDASLVGLNVTITNLMDAGAEFLQADVTGTSISTSYDAGTGVLTLSGTDSVANYEQVLRTISYDNASIPPDGTTRVIAFVADDGLELGNLADSRIAIVITNIAPTASADAASVAEGGSVVIDLAANDDDYESALDLASIQIVTGTSNGSLLVAADGTVTYTHDGSETTNDTFTYTIRDATGAVSNLTTATITIDPVNDAPTATDESYSVDEDASLAVDNANGVLSNESDAEGNPLSATLVTGPSNAASFTLNADGSFDYSPTSDFDGTDSFSYRVSDGSETSGMAVVTLTVLPINDAPTLAINLGTISSAGTADVITSGELAAVDMDNAGSELSYSLPSAPSFGHLELLSNPGVSISSFTQADIDSGRLVYLLDDSTATSDSFAFVVSDSHGASVGQATFEISVHVNPPDSIPIELPEGESADEQPENEPAILPEPDEPSVEDETSAREEQAPEFEARELVLETRTEIRFDETVASVEIDGADDVGGESERIFTWHQEQRGAESSSKTFAPAMSALDLEQAVSQALDDAQSAMRDPTLENEDSLLIWAARCERVVMAAGIGLAMALVRGGSLMALTASSVPIWKGLDPVAALLISDDRRKRVADDARFAERIEDETDGVGRVLDDEPT